MKITEKLEALLKLTIDKKASDLHLSVLSRPLARINGQLTPVEREEWTEEVMKSFTFDCLEGEEKRDLKLNKTIDISCSIKLTRFRINIYVERGYFAWAIRRLEDKLRSLEELRLPPQLLDFARLKDGLVLFTGPTGSGKSTSLATLINYINNSRSEHILTIENPIEYIHYNKQSLIHQRELGTDVTSFANSLREALREDPDVILVGEMRDLDTMRAALTAAETGHLVFSTLHSADTVGALDRMLAMYPADEQDSVRRQLSMVLKGVVAQRLMLDKTGSGRMAILEILKINSAVSNLIRTTQFAQIYSVLETSSQAGMQSFDQALARAVIEGHILEQDALPHVRNQSSFTAQLNFLNGKSPQSQIPKNNFSRVR